MHCLRRPAATPPHPAPHQPHLDVDHRDATALEPRLVHANVRLCRRPALKQIHAARLLALCALRPHLHSQGGAGPAEGEWLRCWSWDGAAVQARWATTGCIDSMPRPPAPLPAPIIAARPSAAPGRTFQMSPGSAAMDSASPFIPSAISAPKGPSKGKSTCSRTGIVAGMRLQRRGALHACGATGVRRASTPDSRHCRRQPVAAGGAQDPNVSAAACRPAHFHACWEPVCGPAASPARQRTCLAAPGSACR